MAKFVPDVKTQRWIVISPWRAFRPSQSREEEKASEVVVKKGFNFRVDCPFCVGNEAMTPPEIARIQKTGEEWQIRVVPNKFPITDVHEVIIHSPDHKKDIIDFPLEHVTELITVYRERYKILSQQGSVIIFNNKGLASGESLLHPHSQIVVVPKQIKMDVLQLEPVRNVVSENDYFVVYCPDFSQWPYEVWITMKKFADAKAEDSTNFGQITDEEISHLAGILQGIIKKLNKKFPDLSYNFYIFPFEPWYLRIIPRVTSKAGFELGTGLNVNVVDPAKAAEELRAV